MRCLYCGEELPALLDWVSGYEFCSPAHREKYEEQMTQLALGRLRDSSARARPPEEPARLADFSFAGPPEPQRGRFRLRRYPKTDWGRENPLLPPVALRPEPALAPGRGVDAGTFAASLEPGAEPSGNPPQESSREVGEETKGFLSSQPIFQAHEETAGPDGEQPMADTLRRRQQDAPPGISAGPPNANLAAVRQAASRLAARHMESVLDGRLSAETEDWPAEPQWELSTQIILEPRGFVFDTEDWVAARAASARRTAPAQPSGAAAAPPVAAPAIPPRPTAAAAAPAATPKTAPPKPAPPAVAPPPPTPPPVMADFLWDRPGRIPPPVPQPAACGEPIPASALRIHFPTLKETPLHPRIEVGPAPEPEAEPAPEANADVEASAELSADATDEAFPGAGTSIELTPEFAEETNAAAEPAPPAGPALEPEAEAGYGFDDDGPEEAVPSPAVAETPLHEVACELARPDPEAGPQDELAASEESAASHPPARPLTGSLSLLQEPGEAPVAPAPMSSSGLQTGIFAAASADSAPAEGGLSSGAKMGIVVVLAAAGLGFGLWKMMEPGSGAASGKKTAAVTAATPGVEVAGMVLGDEGWRTDYLLDEKGARKRHLSFFRPSMMLKDYRVEFQGEIESKAMGWVVRAADSANHWGMKLYIAKPGAQPEVHLARWPVLKGKDGEIVDKPLPMRVGLDTTYRVRLDVQGAGFQVYVQNKLIDEWTDTALATGGFGISNEGAERGQVRNVQVWHLRPKR